MKLLGNKIVQYILIGAVMLAGVLIFGWYSDNQRDALAFGGQADVEQACSGASENVFFEVSARMMVKETIKVSRSDDATIHMIDDESLAVAEIELPVAKTESLQKNAMIKLGREFFADEVFYFTNSGTKSEPSSAVEIADVSDNAFISEPFKVIVSDRGGSDCKLKILMFDRADVLASPTVGETFGDFSARI